MFTVLHAGVLALVALAYTLLFRLHVHEVLAGFRRNKFYHRLTVRGRRGMDVLLLWLVAGVFVSPIIHIGITLFEVLFGGHSALA